MVGVHLHLLCLPSVGQLCQCAATDEPHRVFPDLVVALINLFSMFILLFRNSNINIVIFIFIFILYFFIYKYIFMFWQYKL